jgi:hypothetical protein
MKTLGPVHRSQPFHLSRHREARLYKPHQTDFLLLADIPESTSIRRSVSRSPRIAYASKHGVSIAAKVYCGLKTSLSYSEQNFGAL